MPQQVDVNALGTREKGVRVKVSGRLWNTPRLLGEHLIKFERGYCFLEEPGKNIVEIWPKRVLRVNDVTLVVETGFWQYGKLTMMFDLNTDAVRTEKALQNMIPGSPGSTSITQAKDRTFASVVIVVLILFALLLGAVFYIFWFKK